MHAERLALIAIAVRAAGGCPRVHAMRLALSALNIARVDDIPEEDRREAIAWATPGLDEVERDRRHRIGESLRRRAALLRWERESS